VSPISDQGHEMGDFPFIDRIIVNFLKDTREAKRACCPTGFRLRELFLLVLTRISLPQIVAQA
jgi:hypothetical protein